MDVRQTLIRLVALVVLFGSAIVTMIHSGFAGTLSRSEPVLASASTSGIRPLNAAIRPALPAVARPAAATDAPPPVTAAEQPGAAPTEVQALSDFGLPCGLGVSSSAMPGAMVALDIMDPCRPNARVEVEHDGMTIAAMTDAMGLLTLDIPAFASPARFEVRLEDGSSATTRTDLPDLDAYARVAVTWEEDRALELHAFQNGALFGAPGHVWQERPGRLEAALSGRGGVLTVLGDPEADAPRLAQVYTVPREMWPSVAVSVDIPVTRKSCGQPVRAQRLRMQEGGGTTAARISLTLPGCEAVGEYLVLQNLFDDRRLASN